jgi:hypothetical protein
MMRREPKIRERPRACPWANHATHNKNRMLQVNGEIPIVAGYCAQEKDCAACAGTLYKPNLRIEQGRSFQFVECPFCTPDLYRKRVERLKPTLRPGMGPTRTPLDPPPAAEESAPAPKRRPPPRS